MLTQDEIDRISENVNNLILANYPVMVLHKNYKDAVGDGAMALFGEKYGDVVRVIRTGWPDEKPVSMELCGGTHVTQTAEIGSLVIVSEGSVGAGLRRIEGADRARRAAVRSDALEETAKRGGVSQGRAGRDRSQGAGSDGAGAGGREGTGEGAA